jgi:hypothetical protein
MATAPKILALVEHPEDLRAVAAESTLVALTPLVEVAALAEGRPYRLLRDYVAEERVQEEGLENFARAERLCAKLDAIVASAVGTAEELTPVAWHFYSLKTFYDAYLLRAREIEAILAAEAPGTVIFSAAADSIYAPLLECFLRSSAIAGRRLERPPAQPAVAARAAFRTRVRLGLVRLHALMTFLPRGLFRRRRAPRVLCLDWRYSTPAIARELIRRECDVLVWPGGFRTFRYGSLARWQHPPAARTDAAAFTRAWAGVEADEEIRAHFVAGGVDLWPAVAPTLRLLIERDVPLALAQYAAAEAALRRLRPAALLTSGAVDAREKAICDAARQAGVPTIVSRHGECGTRHVEMVVHQDVASVDWALTWGRWEADWTARHAPRPVRTVVVGAPMIETAAARAPERAAIRRALGVRESDSVALYVPTALSGNDWYGGYRAPTDSSYFRQQTEIMRALVAQPALRLIVKEHGAVHDSPLARWCAAFAPAGRASVIREPDFASLIHLADLVVLDAPSTTLAFALFGSAPIYIVDHPVYRWEPGVIEHLTAHGVAFTTSGELAARLRASVPDVRGYSADAREPVVAGPAGAAARAADAIVEIAGGEEPAA